MWRTLFNGLFGRAAATPASRDVVVLTQDGDRHAREGRLHAALAAYRAALALDPAALDAQLGLGNVLLDLWMPGDAVAAYERALELAPHSTGIRSALLFHRHYLPRIDAQA